MTKQEKRLAYLDYGALCLWNILETDGPAGKAGLSGLLAKEMNRSISPQKFEEILHHARVTLSPRKGRAIVYDHWRNQYGFPEDIVAGLVYILSYNASYLGTRCQTMAIQSEAVMDEYAEHPGLKSFAAIANGAAASFHALRDQHADEARAWRAAHRGGVDAEVEIEQEEHDHNNGNGATV